MAGVSETKMRLILLIDSKANKVVFAEADKDFVDFLFDILSLSVGTVMQLLDKKDMVGCLGDLYRGAEALNQDYMLPQVTKDLVLKQQIPVDVPLLSLKHAPPAMKRFYLCTSHTSYVTDGRGANCPSCHCELLRSATYIAPKSSGDMTTLSSASGGYVKSMIKYMVMDNLEVRPMSLSLMKSHVKDISSLTQQDVEVGLNEGLAILEASLNTRSVLTTVFLGMKMES